MKELKVILTLFGKAIKLPELENLNWELALNYVRHVFVYVSATCNLQRYISYISCHILSKSSTSGSTLKPPRASPMTSLCPIYAFYFSHPSFFFNLFMFIYLERKREKEGWGGARGTERESQAGAVLAVITEPNMGLDSTNCEIVT